MQKIQMAGSFWVSSDHPGWKMPNSIANPEVYWKIPNLGNSENVKNGFKKSETSELNENLDERD
jgi:hypothetical protein